MPNFTQQHPHFNKKNTQIPVLKVTSFIQHPSLQKLFGQQQTAPWRVHDVVVARKAVGPVLLDFRSDPT